MGGTAPAALSDDELLKAIVESGGRLLRKAQERLAPIAVTDDERWEAPLPLRVESQVAGLFLGALDAYDVTTNILRARASQQAFNGLRFQMESLALIRWMTESPEPSERQLRAYRVVCGQITRWGKFLMEDAGRDTDALQGVHDIREWGRRLREIAKDDGFQHLKREPGRRGLLAKYGPTGGYQTFSMLSELGSHPGAAGNILFSLRPESRTINYDLQGAFVLRAFWTASAIAYLWETCEAVSNALDWDEWLTSEAKPVYEGAGALMGEALRRHRDASAPAPEALRNP